jgi:hypothetical protein
MTSVAPSAGGFSQSNGYFVATGSVQLQEYTPGSGSGGSFLVGTFAAGTGLAAASGDVLRDMGKTVVSSGRTFRKVQFVSSIVGGVPGGVTGTLDSAHPTVAFRTGYIEIGSGLFGNGSAVVRPAVQYYPSLM